MKRFVAGADRGQHCLPDVACDGHGHCGSSDRSEKAAALRDKTTADLFGKLARAIDAQIWFLRSPSR